MMREAGLLIILVSLLLCPIILQAQDSTLINFEIKDQFDRIHRYTAYIDNILIVIGSDNEGSQFNQRWSSVIHNSLKNDPGYERIAFLPVANVRGVPFLLKGFVKSKFPKEEDKWVLMDWEGDFAESYNFEEKSTNILVFDPNGKLAHRAHGRELEDDILEGILTTIREILRKGS